eukprot:jgi/Botrbrau1/14067/Bobra.182_3s0014.1
MEHTKHMFRGRGQGSRCKKHLSLFPKDSSAHMIHGYDMSFARVDLLRACVTGVGGGGGDNLQITQLGVDNLQSQILGLIICKSHN